MKKVKFLYDKVMEITEQVGKDHVGAYAAQAAYFFMLSLIPIILLLITLVQYTPVTKADVMTAVLPGVSKISRQPDHIHCESGI